jgi:hypothetical protein
LTPQTEITVKVEDGVGVLPAGLNAFLIFIVADKLLYPFDVGVVGEDVGGWKLVGVSDLLQSAHDNLEQGLVAIGFSVELFVEGLLALGGRTTHEDDHSH